MRIRVLALVSAFFLMGFSSMAEQKQDKTLQSFLDAIVEKGLPGVSVAVATKDGVVWSGVSGYSNLNDKTPIREDHLFGIGSITKTFVSAVTMQLIEEGRITADQTPLSILGADVVGKVPGADKATIAQLLNHTSGVPSWEDDPVWQREGRGADLDAQKIWGKTETLPYIENTPAVNAPGEKYSYSNTNHTLLGLIIEKITGNDAVDEIRERILKPAGVTDIYLEGFQPVPTERLATRYHYATDHFKEVAGLQDSFVPVGQGIIDVSATNLSVEWAAGGMVATARDLAIYGAAFGAGKLLKPETHKFIEQWVPARKTADVGHGVFRRLLPNDYKMQGHSGSVLGYTGNLVWSESEDLSIAVLANVGTMHIGEDLPGAYDLGLDPEFVEAVRKYLASR